MDWTEEQKADVINQLMDTATNLDNFRQVLILTMSVEGVLSVIQKRRDDATMTEALGIYNLMAHDTEDQLVAYWQDKERPCKSDEE